MFFIFTILQTRNRQDSGCRCCGGLQLQAPFRTGQRQGQVRDQEARHVHGDVERFAFRDTVGLEVTEIDAEDMDGVLEAIRAGRTKILGRRTPPRFFIGNIVTYIYRAIVKNARRV